MGMKTMDGSYTVSEPGEDMHVKSHLEGRISIRIMQSVESSKCKV